MCGIVAYVGHENTKDYILNGLQRLEYRGYDSAGVFLSDGTASLSVKVADKVAALKNAVDAAQPIAAHLGMGHTRWATHGKPTQENAHPHFSNSGDLVLIHNGIIENYDVLQKKLSAQGVQFKSETDTEILINFIEYVQQEKQCSLETAVKTALHEVVGAYGLVVYDRKEPHQLLVARLGSPLAIGVKDDAYYIGSDATPFLEFTKDVVYLEDYEMAVLKAGTPIALYNLQNGHAVTPDIQQLQLSLANIQKSGYDHFMLKEIYEQPEVLQNTLRGRLKAAAGQVQISSFETHKATFENAQRIIIVACGTSWHAGLVGEYLIESFARIPVEVEYASEFRYRDPVVHPSDIVIPISQSGETADTLAALKMAKAAGAFINGICNVVGASIARETDSGMYTHAGPEIGVASTKAFSSQITVLTMIALKLAEIKNTMDQATLQSYYTELETIPEKIRTVLQTAESVKTVAAKIYEAPNCLYLGRGYNFPVALEGALKLKEISYIHAEGYPAAEMKHGPIALIDEQMPVIVIATRKGNYEKVVSNIQEIKSRKGQIIAIVTEGDQTVKKLADVVMEIPASAACFTPLLATIPLQLLAYYIAVLRGCDVDQPRNLAKSVTVE